jgi:uroporphyrinogen-III decarboxylase
MKDGSLVIVPTVANTLEKTTILCERLGLDAIGLSFWIKHMGVIEEKGGQDLVTAGGIQSFDDIESIALPDPDDESIYQPVIDFISTYRDLDKALYAVTNLGSDPVILGMGFENFALSIYTQPELVQELLNMYGHWQAKVIKNLCKLELDFLWTTDDIAFKTSTYISPEDIRQFLIPQYKKVADCFTKPWIYHSDGMLYDVLDDLLSLGMNGIHPVEPGAMELKILKEKYGKRVALCGNIDVDKLSTGTPGEVDKLVKDAIENAAFGGGYICGSSNSITQYCDPANVEAMSRAIQKYGKY